MNYPTQEIFTGGAMPAARSKIAVALLAAGALSIGLPAQAALPSNALLTIDAGTPLYDTYGNRTNVTPGSWFGMDTDKNGKMAGTEKTPLAQGTAGLVLGVTTPVGSYHFGPLATGVDTNAITAPWEFFGSTGSDYAASIAPTRLSSSGNTATINLSGWTVAWNTIAAIPMGTGAWGTGYTSGIANVTCGVDCSDGDTYTLDYHATVPVGDPSNFGGVQYALHLEGTVITGTKALNDTSITTVAFPVTINVLANDSAVAGINTTTVTPVSPTTQGGTAVAHATTGVVTYTPPTGAPFTGTDTFTYTYRDNSGTFSNIATVTVTVQNNSRPIANPDPLSITAGTSQTVNVLANDTDPDGPPPRGNIDPTTVAVVPTAQPQHGTVTINATTGAITYQASSFVGTDSFQYTVRDTVGETSDPATVTVTINAFTGDWTIPLNPGDVPILFIESGSYFTMQMNSTSTLRINLSAGADGGIILGAQQYAGGSHNDVPTGGETTGIDQPWNFFGNTGMHYSANGGIDVNTDNTGTLNFNNRWFVTWNGIPAINMGGSALDDAAIRGRASIACSNPTPCAEGSAYTVNYSAHVPQGDPSSFGGVPYGLHLTGYVRFLVKTLLADGPITQGGLGLGMRLSATQLANAGIPADTAVGTACIGDCFDFQVTGITGRARVVLPLVFGIRPNSTYRKYKDFVWQDFDTTTLTAGVADTLKSAPLLPGTATCPGIGHASYAPGLIAGNRCVQLDIADGGPNDASSALGTVADPGGVAAAVAVAPPDTRVTGSSGCSLSAKPVNPLERGDWWLLLGFVGWLGLVARRKRAS